MEGSSIAIFTNQATLSYSGGVTNSNVVTGEITDALSVTKTAVSQSYNPGENVTYAVSIVNERETPLTDLTITDDLGGYAFEGATVYPLAYVEGSLLYLVDGVPQAAPSTVPGPPLTVTGVTVPAGGNVTLIYETRVTPFAPLGEGAAIENTAQVVGTGLALAAMAAVPMAGGPELTISKAVSPEVITGSGQLTYTFVIQNSGAEPAVAADAVTVTDGFDPILSGLTAELDGVALTAGADYTYDEAAGIFATVPGRITVPGANFTQNPDSTWTTTPGVTVLTVTGSL